MEAARSPASSPCTPQVASATHCSGLLRPISSAGLDSGLASVSTQSGYIDESAHSVSLPGAVKVTPFIAPFAGSTGNSKLSSGISWAQVAKGSGASSFAPLKYYPPPTEVEFDSPLSPPAEVVQQCNECPVSGTKLPSPGLIAASSLCKDALGANPVTVSGCSELKGPGTPGVSWASVVEKRANGVRSGVSRAFFLMLNLELTFSFEVMFPADVFLSGHVNGWLPGCFVDDAECSDDAAMWTMFLG
ncbi:hypothetical protein Nepgr_001066 [Nepenthes gracilis]|uniref:Uncharacterized protein n=1 Tax=Nepenthes gracilis TaxID=150966 RepID=A0AAD3P7X3_NEPGR|nr:hypothetical protein Nepgr_001066 [Nepenthes gracilis]